MTIDNDNRYPGSDRRTFLRSTAAIAGAGLLAGCSGDGGDGSSGGDGSDGSGGSDGSSGGDGMDGGSGDGGDGGDGSSGPSFPQQQIRMIIPYSTGGGYDAYTRLTSQYLPKHLPNDVNVQPQNVTGAGGIIGTEEIFNSDPDGYTNGIINVSKLGRDQIISDVNFDLREITYYGTVALEVPLITVGKHTDIGSWEDFVGRVQNDELTFGTTGPASTTAANAYLPGEVSGEYSIDDVLDNMVVYDGTSEMVQAILREDIDVIAVAYSSALAYVEDGSVEPLLYLNMADEPPEEVPQAETLATAGVNNGQQIADMVPTRRAFGGPPDIPDERVQILRDAFEATLTEDEEMQAAAEDAGRPITYQDGPTTAEAVAGYVDGWSDRQEILDKIQSA